MMETRVMALQKELNDEKESNNSEEKLRVITGNINNLNDKTNKDSKKNTIHIMCMVFYIANLNY